MSKFQHPGLPQGLASAHEDVLAVGQIAVGRKRCRRGDLRFWLLASSLCSGGEPLFKKDMMRALHRDDGSIVRNPDCRLCLNMATNTT